MSTGWDLASYDRDNQLVLVVEVKSKLDASLIGQLDYVAIYLPMAPYRMRRIFL